MRARYTSAVAEPRLSVTRGGALVAVAVAAAVLWLARDTNPLDVSLRLLLPLLWLAAWTVACLGAGVWLVRGLLSGSRDPDAVVVLTTGAAVLAMLQAVLALAGLLHPIVVVVLLCVAAAEGTRLLVLTRLRPRLPGVALTSPAGVMLAAAAVAVVALLTTPPVMYDALNYHLAFPARWMAAGGFVEFPRHLFSYYPSSHGLLYAMSLASVGPWGAQAIHWWMGAMAVLAAATLGERLGGRSAATWSAACFGLTPAVLEIAGYAIADLAVAAWAGAALVVLTDADEDPPTWRRGALIGVLAGCAVAAKYLALGTVMAAVVAGGAVWLWGRSWRSPSRWAVGAAFAVATAVMVLPWFGRNLVWTGNPVYPYMQFLFGGPPCDRDILREIGRYGAAGGSWIAWIGSTLGAVAVRTIHPLREGGLLGPHWVPLLVAAAFVRGAERRLTAALWAAVVSGAIVWGALVQYARFLLPVLVPAAALAGSSAAAFTRHPSRMLRAAFHGLLLAVLGWNASVLASQHDLERLQVVFGHRSDTQYLRRWVSYAPMIPVVAGSLPPSSRLLLVGEPRSFYLDRPVVVEDPYRQPLLLELARGCGSPDELARRVRALGVTHVLVNEGEMSRLARHRGASDYWGGASPIEREAIDRMLADLVRQVARHGSVWVGELDGSASRADPQ